MNIKEFTVVRFDKTKILKKIESLINHYHKNYKDNFNMEILEGELGDFTEKESNIIRSALKEYRNKFDDYLRLLIDDVCLNAEYRCNEVISKDLNLKINEEK